MVSHETCYDFLGGNFAVVDLFACESVSVVVADVAGVVGHSSDDAAVADDCFCCHGCLLAVVRAVRPLRRRERRDGRGECCLVWRGAVSVRCECHD